MTLYGPIGDGLKRLIGHLEADLWTPEDAKFFLANQDRDYIEVIDPPGPWARIVPLRRVPKEREDALYYEDTAILLHAEQLTEGHAALPPGEWIKLALANNLEPPWLPLIRSLPIAKKLQISDRFPMPATKLSDPNSAQARGGHEKRKNGVPGLVEDDIKKIMITWRDNPSLYLNYSDFLTNMIRAYQDMDASDRLEDYTKKGPAVRDRRTIKKIVDKLTKGKGPPFEKPEGEFSTC